MITILIVILILLNTTVATFVKRNKKSWLITGALLSTAGAAVFYFLIRAALALFVTRDLDGAEHVFGAIGAMVLFFNGLIIMAGGLLFKPKYYPKDLR